MDVYKIIILQLKFLAMNMVKITTWRRLGDKPLSKHMMVSLLAHIHVCVIRPHWVNIRGKLFIYLPLLWYKMYIFVVCKSIVNCHFEIESIQFLPCLTLNYLKMNLILEIGDEFIYLAHISLLLKLPYQFSSPIAYPYDQIESIIACSETSTVCHFVVSC